MIAAPDVHARYDAVKHAFTPARLHQLAEGLGLPVERTGRRCGCPTKCSETDPRCCTLFDEGGIGLWSCKRCGAKGSVIDFLMMHQGLERFAALEAAEAANGTMPPPKEPAAKKRARDLLDLGGVRAIWPRFAARDERGEKYLAARGLSASVEHGHVRFAVGAGPDWWTNSRAREGYRPALLLRNSDGAVVSFQLRATHTPADPKKTKIALYGVGTSGLVFGNPLAARAARVVVVAEGFCDYLACSLAARCVIGAPGEGQVPQVADHLGDARDCTVVLAPQNDLQHHKSEIAFEELATRLKTKGFRVVMHATPAPFKDPAEHLQAVGLDTFRTQFTQ